jgi:hypothetical protein
MDGLIATNLRGSCVVAVSVALASSATAQVLLTNHTDNASITTLHQPQQDIQPWVCGGMGAGDFNKDGATDFFVVAGGVEPDKLFINNGNGTFSDRADQWGLTDIHIGNGVAVGDYNNDGRLDLYVTSAGNPALFDQVGQNRLYRNDGNGFTEVAAQAGVNFASATSPAVYGATFGDYDLDGDLDLFVSTWQNPLPFEEPRFGNRLYRNNGDETFTDVTASSFAPGVLDGISGFQPAFADMDRDLFPEILIAADFETSRYLVNNGDGTFTDQTVGSGTGLDDNGMGQTVADFNNDGRLDWYVTSIYQDTPPPGNNPGNMLYMAVDDHLYDEQALETGTLDGGWGWGTIAVDLDQDGWLDIVEVNGRETEPAGEWTNEPAKLFYNVGGGSFVEIAATCGFDHDDSGRSIIELDMENDGDMDFAVFTNSGRVDLYRNDTPFAGRWLQVTLNTRDNPLIAPDGFGTRVEARVGADTYVRFLNGQPSFLATSAPMLHFGLGGASVIDELSVFWTRGNVTVLEQVAVNQKIDIRAPEPTDVNADGAVDIDDLVAVILAWGDPSGPADVNGVDGVNIDDLVAVVIGMNPAS